ncbi:hypothetical protein SDC9_209527 [bioreactor metagenome]|uniref:Uncharacterized protein n=1 Tax=bioreactor metagenome TaxID=1076179 RepID=A0A645JN79_9ZZZZ
MPERLFHTYIFGNDRIKENTVFGALGSHFSIPVFQTLLNALRDGGAFVTFSAAFKAST